MCGAFLFGREKVYECIRIPWYFSKNNPSTPILPASYSKKMPYSASLPS